MLVDEYVTTLLEQISNEKAKTDIETEIRQHIDNQIESYRLDGMEEKDAIEASVRDMGDPVEAGVELNRIHRPQMPWKMFLFIIFIAFVGLFVKIQFLSQWYSIEGEIIMMGLGIVIMLGVCMVDYSVIGKYSRQLMVIILMVFLFGNHSYADLYEGNLFWSLPGGVTIAPINLLMCTVPLYGGILYCYRWGKQKSVLKCIAWMLLPCFVTFYFYSEVSRTFLILLIELATLMIALHKGWFHVNVKRWMRTLITGLVAVSAVIIAVVYHLGGYRRMMLLSWFEPYHYENGYIINLVREIVQNSRFAGKSVMADRFFMLPSIGHDYMLTFVMSQYGIAAALIILFLFVLFCIMLYRGVWRQKNQLGRLMGTSCCILISVEFIFYVLADTGLLFRTYTDCPFLSIRSFSSNLLNYFILGILLSIYRYQNVLPAHGPIAYPVKEAD